MKLLLGFLFSIFIFPLYSGNISYAGNPINHGTGITINSYTSPTLLNSYTQSINLSGLLDNTFGSLGIAIKNISGFADGTRAMALQQDGKIVVVGVTNINGTVVAPIATPTGVFATMRYNTDGTLDTSFGPNGTGIVTYSFSGPGFVDGATGVAIQADGKIVVVGQTNIYNLAVAPAATGTGYFGIIRYNSNGTPDLSFGPNGNGTITKNFSGAGNVDGANAVSIQPDGKIIVTGGTNLGNTAPGTGSFATIRYNSNGTVDNAFGPNGNGTVTQNISGVGSVDAAFALVIQPDGKIIVAGATNTNTTVITPGIFALIRYDANGIRDTTFGTNGIVTTSLSGNIDWLLDCIFGISLQPDGKILVVGGKNINAGNGFAGVGTIVVVRYTSTGTLDSTFGQNGVAELSISTIIAGADRSDVGRAIVLQPDGKILITGQTNANGNGDANGSIFVARYNQNGTLDTTFGSNTSGIVTTKISVDGRRDGAWGLSLKGNGKIVVAGQINIATPGGSQAFFSLSQYINPFTLPTFTASYGSVGLL